jgi:hypothetical protein
MFKHAVGTQKEKMLSIRIPYEVGKRLKAVCALRGVTVRDLMTGFATEFVDHADELPPPSAANSVKLAALSAAVMRNDYEAKREPPPPAPRVRKKTRG